MTAHIPVDTAASPVTLTRESGIGLILIDNPPVNALSQAVRAGLWDCIGRAEADPDIDAIVVLCMGRTFCAGADIREFGRPMQDPALPALIERIEDCSKPVIAALHGTALGGGLEVALGCHFRIALPAAKLGLPEVKLGLLPGAGGTQRLPRLVGVEAALQMILEGDPVDGLRAHAIGLVDELASGELRASALGFARRLITERRAPRRTRDLAVPRVGAEVFARVAAQGAKRHRGYVAPVRALEAVRAAAELPWADGIARERAIFLELMQTPQSKAQRHVFFAEREVAKTPGLPQDLPTRPVRSAAVLGAGTMGQGIAVCFADAGIPTQLLDSDAASLQRGVAAIRKIYDTKVARGTLSSEAGAQRLALVSATQSYEQLAAADVVVEAVFEDLAVKQQVFREVDARAKPGAILATNTSYLSIDAIAAVTQRPQDVVGLHFFSPANVMKLLEVVRGARTGLEVQASAMRLGKMLGKVAVLVGNCDGFVGNRMLAKRTREAFFLLEEGATPWQVDQVLYDFGFPMGPFAVGDLAGLDIGWRNRKSRLAALTPRERACNILDELCELGRFGQKSGAGFYQYDAQRTATADPLVEALIVRHSAAVGIARRALDAREILERCLFALINEAAKILEEGIVTRALDVDIVWLYGYGFPRYRGGPLYYADQIGLASVLEGVQRYGRQLGAEYWTPAPLLERLVREGRGFYGPG
ncbi:MAG TPA: 3-hydroxyacyl-CoA dehydrogenase NAD-binding domain-containing protein [Steroidobacteraceae bacterium]